MLEAEMQSYSRIGRKQVLFFLNFIISAIDRVLFLGPGIRNGGQVVEKDGM